MPIPKPRKGEPKDAFISRCISSIAKTDPNMPNDQRVAICINSWKGKEIIVTNSKEMNELPKLEMDQRHPDFDHINKRFTDHFPEDGEDRYQAWLLDMDLDDTKAYNGYAQGLEQMFESFSWVPYEVLEDEVPNGKLWKVYAIYDGYSLNKNPYDPDKLPFAARSLEWRNVNINHEIPIVDTKGDRPSIEMAYTRQCEFEDGCVESIVFVHDDAAWKDEEKLINVQKALEKREIRHVSIEGRSRFVPGDITFTGLGLLTKDCLPGDPLAHIEPYNTEELKAFSEKVFAQHVILESLHNKPIKKDLVIAPVAGAGIVTVKPPVEPIEPVEVIVVNFEELLNIPLAELTVGQLMTLLPIFRTPEAKIETKPPVEPIEPVEPVVTDDKKKELLMTKKSTDPDPKDKEIEDLKEKLKLAEASHKSYKEAFLRSRGRL